MATPDERFDAKWQLDPETGCHVWTRGTRGETHRGGQRYPAFWFEGRAVGAYGWAWERKNGPAPSGAVFDHFHCENTLCVNPDHVRPVTQRENILRSNSQSALNAAKTTCLRGHPLDGPGADVHLDTNGTRQCRTCKHIRRALARAR